MIPREQKSWDWILFMLLFVNTAINVQRWLEERGYSDR